MIFFNLRGAWKIANEVEMRQISIFALAVSLAMIGPITAQAQSSKAREHPLLRFDRARVISVCKRACHSPGGNPRVCCICNGGDWIGGHCA